MGPLIIAAFAGRQLGAEIARALGQAPVAVVNELFPDGERHISLQDEVRGRAVFIVQPTGAPVGDNLLELLLVADAAWRSGAARVCAVVPYLGYARQDRRSREGDAVGLRIVADVLAQGRFERLVLVDLHSPATEGCFSSPVEHVTALPLLADAVRPFLAEHAVVVSPDLGAAKLAVAFARRLTLPVATVHKTRIGPSRVTTHSVAGDVRDRTPVLVDDMISTGATIAAATFALKAAGARGEALVVATHGLFTPGAAERLGALAIRRFFVTNSLAPADPPRAHLECVSLAPLLAEVIRRLDQNRPLADLLALR